MNPDHLPMPERVAFCAAICERALPLYTQFSERVQWGDPRVLRDAVDYLWEVTTGSYDSERGSQLVIQCEQQAPHAEDFATYLNPFARHALWVVCYSLDVVAETDRVEAVVGAARDTTDLFVMMRDDVDLPYPKLREKLDRDPVSVAEAERQQWDLALLARGDIAALRARPHEPLLDLDALMSVVDRDAPPSG